MRLTFLIAKQYREEGMRKAIAGAIMLTTLTVAIQSIAQTPPPTAGTYHAAIAAGRACGQPDDQ